jgi:hypothetical protein
MVYLDDDVYEETKQIALGGAKRSPMLIELSDWFQTTYSVKILNFQFSRLKIPNTKIYRLYVIIENTEDYQKMYVRTAEPIEEFQQQIAAEFQRLALKYHFASKDQLKDLFVIYNDFSEEAKTEANWKAIKEIKKFITIKYPYVWEVIAIFSNSVVFYYSDQDIIKYQNNGSSKMIADEYYSTLKACDVLDYFTRENINLKFDSKEKLDKNYDGNLFYYTR